jgi:hypothetical protein
VVTNGQSLSEVVGNVQQSRNVPDEELQLGDAILKPMHPHVTRLGELGLHRPVGDADCDLVVAVDDRRRRGVA